VLQDPDGTVARAYAGRSGSDLLVIIRPDRYVGFVASPPDAGAVDHYLRDLLDAVV
jgi:hypothetical protein